MSELVERIRAYAVTRYKHGRDIPCEAVHGLKVDEWCDACLIHALLRQLQQAPASERHGDACV